MPLPLLPIIVVTLIGTAYHQSNKKDVQNVKGQMTPARQHLFETAYNEYRDPDKLRKLAKTYRDNGLPGPATLLEKRAALRELPEEVQIARRAAFRKAMSSTNPQAVNTLANVFEGQGAIGAAAALRKYAASIPPPPADVTPEPAKAVTPTPPVPPPPPAEVIPEAPITAQAPESEPAIVHQAEVVSDNGDNTPNETE